MDARLLYVATRMFVNTNYFCLHKTSCYFNILQSELEVQLWYAFHGLYKHQDCPFAMESVNLVSEAGLA